jgi:cobalt-zinc-cadmium efflux system membrane fusion protein
MTPKKPLVASLLSLAAAAASGCRAPQPSAEPAEPKAHAERSAPHGPHDEGHEGHEGHEGREAGEAVVRIDPSMLRDLHLTTARVEARSGAESSPVVGELRVPEDRYAEVASPVTARVVRVPVTAGDVVRRGQTLAELESLDLGRARGDLQEALARVELARTTLERKRSLAEERIAPRREVQEAEAALRSAEAALGSARAALQAMGAGDDAGPLLRLRAPLSGTLIERTLVPGQMAEPARTLFRIGDLSALWLIAHAPERDAVRVPLGAAARIAIPALPGESISARVRMVGSQVEVGSRTVPVRLEVQNPGGALRPGMSATVWLPVGEGASLLAVPAAALQRLDDRWSVFVPGAPGVFEVRPVGRGRDLGGEVEIVSGLRAGETVVVEGAFLLKAEADKARGEGGHHDH